jgi:hypothetical protein
LNWCIKIRANVFFLLPYLFFLLPQDGCLAMMRRGAANDAAGRDEGGGGSNGS